MNEQENDQSHAEGYQAELERREQLERDQQELNNDPGYLFYLKLCNENDLRNKDADRKLKKAV